MTKIISHKAVRTRKSWVSKIEKSQGEFYHDVKRLENELAQEIKKDGYPTLINHLR